MIRRLTLTNWRSYEHVTVEFEAGTTFVVASNGVGKTSLVEAARWALFGTTASGHSAIRAGANSAVASVELELPDQRVLYVERSLTGGTRHADTPVVRLDGGPISEHDLAHHLTEAYGTEPGFLARLTMPAIDRSQDVPAALGLEAHLGRYFGIDGLRNAVEQLKARRKAIETQIKRIKDANSTSAQRLAQMEANVERTEHSVEQATETHRGAQQRLDRARERDRRRAELAAWQTDQAAWTEATERLAARVAADLGEPVPVDRVEVVLDEQLTNLSRQIEAVRIQMGVNTARESTLASNAQDLDAAHDDCPICRRPLDDATVALAHQANAQDLAAIRQTTARLKTAESELLEHHRRTKVAQDEWRRIRRPGPPPQALLEDEDDVAAADLATLVETALNGLVEARAAHVQATTALQQAREANRAMADLESLFRQDAILKAAIDTTASTVAELLDETIRPLASQVNRRWQALFPGRGNLQTFPDGNITRTVNGHPLPYDSLSTGEGMGATILLRLLVAQMTSTAGFCWFDEPLEHLDPDVRRMVANMLSRVPDGMGGLRQVVVTTYEEPLARQLHVRDQQRVKLLNVRQAA